MCRTSCAKIKKILVLHAFRPFLRLLSIYNIENFTDRLIRGPNILLVSLSLITVVSTFAALTLNGWSCIRYKCNLIKNSDRIVAIVGITQQFIIYLSICFYNRVFTNAIESLQKIVENRKIRVVRFHILCITIREWNKKFLSGFKRWPTFYKDAEEHYSTRTKQIYMVGKWMVFLTFAPPLSQPILYAILKYPDTTQWMLPYRFR